MRSPRWGAPPGPGPQLSQASACEDGAPILSEAEKADPQLRIVFKELPILGPGSEFVERAALASQRQERYEAFHHAVMAAKEKVNEESVLAAAAFASIARRGFAIGDQVLRGATELNVLQGMISQARKETEMSRTMPIRGAN